MKVQEELLRLAQLCVVTGVHIGITVPQMLKLHIKIFLEFDFFKIIFLILFVFSMLVDISMKILYSTTLTPGCDLEVKVMDFMLKLHV